VNPIDFRAPEAGQVITTLTGYAAFVPAPLPPRIAYTAELVRSLSRADAALGELAGLGRQVPNPELLIASYVRREAVLSSRIEGTQASLDDLLRDEAGEAVGDPADVREVRNYVAALNHGIARLPKFPLSLRLVRELHAILMRGVRGDRATPGEFRRSQNWIGSSGSTLATAAYVPPPPDRMKQALHDWELFLHQRNALPDLVQCALVHEQFEAIHPFLDGNGRVGRLLVTLFLVERERLSQPLLYLSEYIDAHRAEHYDRLQSVRTDGDWDGWLRFFLDGVTQTARKAVVQAVELLALREKWRRKLLARPRALVLVDALFQNPYVDVARAQKLLGVSNPTARQVVTHLEQEGLLREVTGRAWGRLYRAGPILEAITGSRASPRRPGGRSSARRGP
jgi:Fic family protein